MRPSLVLLCCLPWNSLTYAEDAPKATAENAPAIRISPETTYITAPLTERGLPDYRTYMNERMSKGITNDDNALILYWRAMGNPEGNAEFREKLEKYLGVTLFDPTQPHMVSLPEANGIDPQKDGAAVQALYDLQTKAMSTAWTETDYPQIAKWLKVNERPLELASEASLKEHYYNPLIGESNDMLIAALLPGVQSMREFSRMLSARAMLKLGHGDVVGAQQDLLTIHRMGRHVSQGWSLIEGLVGCALESVACAGDQTVANSPLCTAEQLKAYQLALAKLGQFDRFADILDYGERFMSLDAVVHLADPASQEVNADAFGILEFRSMSGSGAGAVVQRWLLRNAVDWNVVMVMVNEHFDRSVQAARLETHWQRSAALKKIEDDLTAQKQTVAEPLSLALTIFAGSEQRGKNMGTILLALLAPAVRQVEIAEARTNSKIDVAQVGLAIRAYQIENEQLPENLDALVPKYLTSVPVDRFTGRALKYAVRDGEFAVYSVGSNLKDDGGLTFGDIPNDPVDDLVFRSTGWFSSPQQ